MAGYGQVEHAFASLGRLGPFLGKKLECGGGTARVAEVAAGKPLLEKGLRRPLRLRPSLAQPLEVGNLGLLVARAPVGHGAAQEGVVGIGGSGVDGCGIRVDRAAGVAAVIQAVGQAYCGVGLQRGGQSGTRVQSLAEPPRGFRVLLLHIKGIAEAVERERTVVAPRLPVEEVGIALRGLRVFPLGVKGLGEPQPGLQGNLPVVAAHAGGHPHVFLGRGGVASRKAFGPQLVGHLLLRGQHLGRRLGYALDARHRAGVVLLVPVGRGEALLHLGREP